MTETSELMEGRLDIEGNWAIYLKREPWNEKHELLMSFRQPQMTRGVVVNMTLEAVQEGCMPPQQAFYAVPQVDDFIQKLIDEAWRAGFRPSGFNDTRESMKQQTKHLNDMRAIVAKQLKTQFDD